MNRFVKSLLAATAFSAVAAGCASYDYGYGYSQPYAYSYGDGYTADYGPYYDYGPGYYVGPPALGFYYYGDGRDHDWNRNRRLEPRPRLEPRSSATTGAEATEAMAAAGTADRTISRRRRPASTRVRRTTSCRAARATRSGRRRPR